ncbi:MAG: hypothetical protein H7Z15_13425 [Rhizobacter sp.]|nr:hypothetical protein [Rhizobacter sp.]
MNQAAQRVGVLLLVLCIALQAMAHVTQRAAAGLHYHLPVADSVVMELASHDDDHDHEHGHTHRQLAEHAHALADASVRYVVDGDDIAAPQPPAPPPRLHDHDGLLIQLPIGASAIEHERWPAETKPLIRSVISTPLERPPRA